MRVAAGGFDGVESVVITDSEVPRVMSESGEALARCVKQRWFMALAKFGLDLVEQQSAALGRKCLLLQVCEPVTDIGLLGKRLRQAVVGTGGIQSCAQFGTALKQFLMLFGLTPGQGL